MELGLGVMFGMTTMRLTLTRQIGGTHDITVCLTVDDFKIDVISRTYLYMLTSGEHNKMHALQLV